MGLERSPRVEQALRFSQGGVRPQVEILRHGGDTGGAVGERPAEFVAGSGVAGAALLVPVPFARPILNHDCECASSAISGREGDRRDSPPWWDGAMYLASTDAANDLLERDPLALLLGMMLDQQIPMEKAFTSPEVLRERLGTELDAAAIAGADPEVLEEVFRRPPALHRFPAANAKRAQELCAILRDRYDGDAARVWQDAASGADLIARLQELPGFGSQKARIFAALVGKQLGVKPRGWRAATEPYGAAGYRSAADVVDPASLAKVKAYKREQKAAAKAERG
jgi:uncharacterized HhH-GPD family protein